MIVYVHEPNSLFQPNFALINLRIFIASGRIDFELWEDVKDGFFTGTTPNDICSLPRNINW